MLCSLVECRGRCTIQCDGKSVWRVDSTRNGFDGSVFAPEKGCSFLPTLAAKLCRAVHPSQFRGLVPSPLLRFGSTVFFVPLFRSFFFIPFPSFCYFQKLFVFFFYKKLFLEHFLNLNIYKYQTNLKILTFLNWTFMNFNILKIQKILNLKNFQKI